MVASKASVLNIKQKDGWIMELSNNGKLAQQLLEAAVEQGASDMHIEPM